MEFTDPLSVGLSPTRLEIITKLMQRYIDSGRFAGMSALVARRGEIAYISTVGVQDLETGVPIFDDTIFRVYSMTKPLTCAALMTLYEEAAFSFDDPIEAYLPEFADMRVHVEHGIMTDAASPITIRQLLTHTAGLGYGWDNVPPVDLLYAQANLHDQKATTAELIERLADLPLYGQPGARWQYSMSQDVLGRLIELLSGQRFADFLHERICEPLGMVDTAFHIEPSKLDRFATLYNVTADNPLAVLDAPATSSYLPPVNADMGGSGLVSTLRDYYRFAQCMLNGGTLDGVSILGRKTVERMTLNHLPDAFMPIDFDGPLPGIGYGLGYGITVNPAQAPWMGSAGDFGWGGYAETYHWCDPQEDLVAIMMTQCIPSMHYPIRKEFRAAVYQALVD